MNTQILEGNISMFRECGFKPTALNCGCVPVDIDVSPFDNSGSHKKGVSRTYKRSPLKTSCERKCAVRAIFVIKPPRKAYSLTSSAFLESGTPCPFLLFAPVFRGSQKC